MLAHAGDEFGGDRRIGFVHAGFEDHKAERRLALQGIGHADHRAFGDIGMAGEDFFHLAGGEAMAGDIDDVIGAAHHPDIAIGVDHPGIGGVVIAGVVLQIGLAEALGRLP